MAHFPYGKPHEVINGVGIGDTVLEGELFCCNHRPLTIGWERLRTANTLSKLERVVSASLWISPRHTSSSSGQVSSWPVFRGEEVAAIDTNQRRRVKKGSAEKEPKEGCTLSRLGAKGDPMRFV